MANLRDIKTRIDSVKNTRQITNAMKMISAAYLRKAQQRIIAARPYANYIDTMLRTLKVKNAQSQHPLLVEPEEGGKTLMVVVTADRGLCGSFNTSIIREATRLLEDTTEDEDIICIGKKCYDHLKKRTDNMIAHYTGLFNEMNFSQSKEIADLFLDLYLNKGYNRVRVLYNEFKSAIQQDIVFKQILPIIPLESEIVSNIDYLYEPDEDTIITELGRKYLDVEVWRILLESSAAEQGARMTAMESATDNATEMIGELTLHYNRARQASITTEIIEVASGAEAINQ